MPATLETLNPTQLYDYDRRCAVKALLEKYDAGDLAFDLSEIFDEAERATKDYALQQMFAETKRAFRDCSLLVDDARGRYEDAVANELLPDDDDD